MRCLTCDEHAATCDDLCPQCCADMYISGEEIYDPNEQASWYDEYKDWWHKGPLVKKRLWDWPGYRDAEKLILAARVQA